MLEIFKMAQNKSPENEKPSKIVLRLLTSSKQRSCCDGITP